MEINIDSIKKRLENSDTFKYYRDETGISFEDFDVIDLQTKTLIKQGSKKIGAYNIMIDGDNMSTYYDLTVDGLTEKKLEKVKR